LGGRYAGLLAVLLPGLGGAVLPSVAAPLGLLLLLVLLLLLAADWPGVAVPLPSVVCDPAVPLGVAFLPSATALVDGVVRCSEVLSGTATPTAAATAAADATVTTALRILRRRARLVISSKVPGGGGSGVTCWFSQRSSASRSLSAGIGFPSRATAFLARLPDDPLDGHGTGAGGPRDRVLQLCPGMVQVSLDRAFWLLKLGRDLLDAEPRVIVQQERLAKLGGQFLDELPDVHVLRRVRVWLGVATGHRLRQRAAFSLHLAPMVTDQVGGDHVEVALRAVQL